MSRTRQFLIAGMAIAVLGCVGPFSEDQESHYSDVNAARVDGAFNRGWLPEIVPDNSVDIWEIHNIASNETWGCFVSPRGTEKIRGKLKDMGASRTVASVSSGPRGLFRVRSWWPQSMTTTTVNTYRFDELGTQFSVIVGLDAELKTACFHRALRTT